MSKNYKEEILRLHKLNKTYREIQKELGCSIGTISYHINAKTKTDTRRRRKIYRALNIKKLKEQLGGRCIICGYSKYFVALDFHHIRPENKRGEIPQLLGTHSYKVAEEESKKCVLLCANCHRVVHAGLVEITEE